MKWLKRLIVAVVVLLAVVVGVAFLLPDRAHVERSISIAREPAQVFAVLDDMRRFNEWSPWYDRDPNAKYTLSGPPSGVGARLAWSGDPDTVGEGSQEIIESTPHSRIRVQLDFGPMGRPVAQYSLAPDDAGTRVTWSFDTELPLAFDADFGWNLMGRYMGLAFDSMIGKDYEAGLAKLKHVVEAEPPPAPVPVEPVVPDAATEDEAAADGAAADGAADPEDDDGRR